MGTASQLNDLVRFSLEVLKGPHAGMKLEFEKAAITIGRGPENDVVLSEDPRVSRNHVEIKQSLGQFYVVNLSQRNFILVNGQDVTSEKLATKTVVQVGESEIRFTILGATSLLEPVSPASTALRPSDSVIVPFPRPPGQGGLSAVPNQGAGAVGFPAPNMPPATAFPPPYQGPNPGAYQQTPPPQGPARPAYKPPSDMQLLLANPKVKMYGVFAVVLVLGFLMLQGGKSKKAEQKAFRTEEELDVTRHEAENEIKAFQERKDKMNLQVYQKAYENFLRGYRDYRQGQFTRSRESFQVVLNLDPENELAKRYLNLAKIRFDELVKFYMLQGRRYLEKQNYRMCQASYQTVMTMLGNDLSSPEYKEALTMHKDCSVALEGRY